MILEATEADVPALVQLGAEFYAQSPHRMLGEYRPQAVGNMLRFLITHQMGVVLWDGQGAVGGLLAPLYFDPQKGVMEASFFWGRKRARHLRKAFETHAAQMGADYVLFSALENDRLPGMHRLLSRDGYTAIERRYVKRV